MIYELEQTLKESVVKVVFTKVNGDERTILCTKNLVMIPTNKIPVQESMPLAVNDSILRVFDIEKNDWRSFRKDSVISWSLYANHSIMF